MNVGNLLNKHNPYANTHASDEWILPTQCIGIEIEIEQAANFEFKLLENTNLWKRVKEGSLRNDGREFATVGMGLLGSGLTRAINDFEKALKKCEATEVSYRTAIHIHLDVTDMTMQEFKTFLVLYCIYEMQLFQWEGNNRDGNIYCVPWAASAGLPAKVAGLFGHTKHDYFIDYLHKHFRKYAALNLESLYRFGTVEFRHLLTTKDMQKVRNWINIIMQLKHSSRAICILQEEQENHDLMLLLSALGWADFNALVWQDMAEQVLEGQIDKCFWDAMADAQQIYYEAGERIERSPIPKGNLLEAKFDEAPVDAEELREKKKKDLNKLFNYVGLEV